MRTNLSYILIILGLLSLRTIHAQTPKYKSHTSFWLNGGLGISVASEGLTTRMGGGYSGRIGLGMQKQKFIFHLRMTANQGGPSIFKRVDLRPYKDEYGEIAIMGGYAIAQNEDIQVVLLSGISRVSGDQVIGREKSSWQYALRTYDTSVGLPVEIGISGRKDKSARIAFYLQGNFNSIAHFFGATLCTNLGWFKD